MIQPVLWIVVFTAGMVCGQFLKFERVPQPNGRAILRPRIDQHPFHERRWVSAVLVLLFVASTTQITWFTYHQRRCNDEFQRVIRDRSVSSTEDNALRVDNDNALLGLIVGVLDIPANSPDARERARTALQESRDRIISNNAKQEQNARYRAEHPIPDPRC